MNRLFGILVFISLMSSQLIGCSNNSNQPLESENVEIGTIQFDTSEKEELSVQWDNGTLFIVRDEELISDFIQLTSGKAYKTDSTAEGIVGNLYVIKYGDMTLDNFGLLNGKYVLDDKTILVEIEALLFDYLPIYNGGRLEFQSDLMPDSNMYIVVKVEKTLDGKLYFVKHQNDYGFESGTVDTDEVFNPGDIIEIKTDGRLPNGDDIEIKAYSISKKLD
jgi:hypothetical protein